MAAAASKYTKKKFADYGTMTIIGIILMLISFVSGLVLLLDWLGIITIPEGNGKKAMKYTASYFAPIAVAVVGAVLIPTVPVLGVAMLVVAAITTAIITYFWWSDSQETSGNGGEVDTAIQIGTPTK